MVGVKLRLEAVSPLLLGTKRSYGGQFIESGEYIQGGTLRGALSHLLLRECTQPGHKDSHAKCPDKEVCKFYRIVGEDTNPGVCFPNCYPTQGSFIPWVLPITARTCKKYRGFIRDFDPRRDKPQDRPHGVFDALIHQLVYDRMKDVLPLIYQGKCPSCGERTESVSTKYYIGDRTLKDYRSTRVARRRRMHVAINRLRHTSEEGLLYSVSAVDEGTIFIGTTFVEEDDLELLKGSLDQLSDLGRIGGARSRGLGEVKVEIEPLKSDSLPPVRERLERFNEEIRRVWRVYRELAIEPVPEEPRGKFFTVDLRSEAILHTPWGEPTLALSEAIIHEEFGRHGVEGVPNVRLERVITSPVYISGWQDAWNLPKEVSLAAAKGSVYLYAIEGISDQLVEALTLLEQYGIGERQAEGFGRMIICDPFHLELNPV